MPRLLDLRDDDRPLTVDIGHVSRHLFRHLPLQTRAVEDEEQRLLGDESKGRSSRHTAKWDSRVSFSAMVCLSACAFFALVAVLLMSLTFRRIHATVNAVDSTISLTDSTVTGIRNFNTILNSTASLAEIVHQLGLKSIDASIFSKPHLIKMLNNSDLLIDHVQHLLDHPEIKIG
tara:strand:- start:115 stop:639 length:525 start_codon:yes stop_codon:yes gene_type:complete